MGSLVVTTLVAQIWVSSDVARAGRATRLSWQARPGLRWAVAATVAAIGFLVFLDRDDDLDPAFAQVGAVGGRRVGLIVANYDTGR